MRGSVKERPSEEKTPADSNSSGYAWRVVLLNCDCHSFDEVERQLIKAVRCTLSRARSISWEVHNKGSAVVYNGHPERCEAVAGVLEDIKLRVKVSQ
ncbi:MAG: ATP-dependent Clp protease adaptor ClpS [Elusimicrobiota bacterium]